MRSYRGLWLWLGGLFLTLFAFLVAIAIACFAKQANYSLFLNVWMLGALLCFLAAHTCFFGAVSSNPVSVGPASFGAVKSWSFPHFGRPGFPGIEVEIYGTGSIESQRESDSGLAVAARLRSFNARFTNTEAGQAANLSVLLYLKLIPGSWGRVGEALCPPPDWPVPPSLGLTPISMPFGLPPGGTISGHLVYEIPGYYLDKIDQPLNGRLELWDHVTDKRVSIPADIGSHDKSAMVPSAGGAEILGPEHESEPDQQGDAEQSSG